MSLPCKIHSPITCLEGGRLEGYRGPYYSDRGVRDHGNVCHIRGVCQIMHLISLAGSEL